MSDSRHEDYDPDHDGRGSPPRPDGLYIPGTPSGGLGPESGGQPYPPAPEAGFSQPYPGYPGEPAPVGSAAYEAGLGNVVKPPPLALAVKLMYVGAVLSLVNLVIGLTQGDAIRRQLQDQAGLSQEAIDTAVAVAFVSGVVAGLIGIALWLFNAAMNARGKKWARILSTVLGALAVLSFLGSFAQPTTPPTVIIGLLMALLAIVIVWLLWRPDSSRYYDVMSRPRF
ncbi:MAG: hypothetical protein ACLGIA_06450 [Actinomycetes bacterium]